MTIFLLHAQVITYTQKLIILMTSVTIFFLLHAHVYSEIELKLKLIQNWVRQTVLIIDINSSFFVSCIDL